MASAADTLNADDVGEFGLGSSGASNNGVFGVGGEVSLRELRVLGDGSGGGKRGDREGNENVLELHLGEIGGLSLCWRCLKRRLE